MANIQFSSCYPALAAFMASLTGLMLAGEGPEPAPFANATAPVQARAQASAQAKAGLDKVNFKALRLAVQDLSKSFPHVEETPPADRQIPQNAHEK
jgi:hypothetical protein